MTTKISTILKCLILNAGERTQLDNCVGMKSQEPPINIKIIKNHYHYYLQLNFERKIFALLTLLRFILHKLS